MKTEEIKYKTCHCGKQISNKAKVCCKEHRINPNINCKDCGCDMPSSKKLGTRCYKCDNKRYKNVVYKKAKPSVVDKIKVIKPHNKYGRRALELNEQAAMEWIEKVIARNGMVSMKELFVDLIDVYYITKYNDVYEHYTPSKQLEFIWKKCLQWYLKNK